MSVISHLVCSLFHFCQEIPFGKSRLHQYICSVVFLSLLYIVQMVSFIFKNNNACLYLVSPEQPGMIPSNIRIE